MKNSIISRDWLNFVARAVCALLYFALTLLVLISGLEEIVTDNYFDELYLKTIGFFTSKALTLAFEFIVLPGPNLMAANIFGDPNNTRGFHFLPAFVATISIGILFDKIISRLNHLNLFYFVSTLVVFSFLILIWFYIIVYITLTQSNQNAFFTYNWRVFLVGLITYIVTFGFVWFWWRISKSNITKASQK